jgi:signal transduction histidine kinase
MFPIFRSLTTKITALLGAIGSIIAVVLTIGISLGIERALIVEASGKAVESSRTLAETLAPILHSEAGVDSTTSIDDTVTSFLSGREKIIGFGVFDADGRCRYKATPPDIDPFPQSLQKIPPERILPIPRQTGTSSNFIYSIPTPIKQGPDRVGTLLTLVYLEEVHDRIYIIRAYMGIMTVGMLLAFIPFQLLAIRRTVINRLRLLEQATGRIIAGERSLRIHIDGKDEISRVTSHINRMTDSLNVLIDSIEVERDFLDATIQALEEGLCAMDLMGTVLMANRSLCDLIGTTIPELIGTEIDSMLNIYRTNRSGEWEKILLTSLAHDMTESDVVSIDGWLRAQNRPDMPVRVSIKSRTSRPEEGEYIVLLRDISNEKSAEALRYEWESFIRHEIKNPLNAIVGFTGMLADPEDSMSPEEQSEIIQVVRHSALTLNAIVEMTREIQAYEEGRITIHKEEIDLVETVNAAVEESKHAIRSAHAAKASAGLISVDHEYQYTLRVEEGIESRVPHDSGKMQRVLKNLIYNAWEHDPDRIVISISADTADYVDISVTNGGDPIPPERLLTIFEKYNTTKSEHGGTGLGTTIAKIFTEAHGGYLTVQSNETDGTTFTIHLPR